MRIKSSGMGYIPELNGIRGVAILLVMAFHAHREGSPSLLPGGYIGVDLFFVLSGLLITSILLGEYEQGAASILRRFYIRRILRLFPALLLLLLVFSLASLLLLHWQQARYNLIEAGIAAFYMTNWSRAFYYHPPIYLAHAWSLSIEEQFYLIWPLLLLGLFRLGGSRPGWKLACFPLLIALASWALRAGMLGRGIYLDRIYNGTDTHIDGLMLGCATALALRAAAADPRHAGWLKRAAAMGLAPALLLLGFICAFVPWESPLMYDYGFFFVAVAAALLMLDLRLNDHRLLRRLLAARWLVWIGSISYGLYLWHFPIYKLMSELQFPTVQIAILGSALSLAAAAASYYLVERRALNWKSRFSQAAAPPQ
jgi:peptidoglycan/LPS O-acetylase OafA/YrhL